jgi:hypothetical protein
VSRVQAETNAVALSSVKPVPDGPGRVVRLKTSEVVFVGSAVDAEAKALELDSATDFSEGYAVEVEVAPGRWGRFRTFGGGTQ